MSIQYTDLAINMKTNFDKAKSEIIIMSAFTTSEATLYLLKDIPNNIKVSLVTRWNKQDICSGSSDLGVAKIIFDKGGRIFRNPRLHAKIYMIDKEKLLFGSANMTSRGLALVKHESNIECMSKIEDVTADDIIFVNSLINDSNIVNKAFIDELQKQIEQFESPDWDESRIQEISSKPKGIFVNDFPFCEYPEILMENVDSINGKHDISIFKLPARDLDMEILRVNFENANIVKWLNASIVNKVSFGELSANIHDALLDEPKPYRKEIKELEINLLNWISILLSDKFQIYVPPGRYSQIIEKIC